MTGTTYPDTHPRAPLNRHRRKRTAGIGLKDDVAGDPEATWRRSAISPGSRSRIRRRREIDGDKVTVTFQPHAASTDRQVRRFGQEPRLIDLS